jgi:hypothetical protein
MWIKASRRLRKACGCTAQGLGGFAKEWQHFGESGLHVGMSTEGRKWNAKSIVRRRQVTVWALSTRLVTVEKVKERGLCKKIQSIFLFAASVRENPEGRFERRKVARDAAKPKKSCYRTEMRWIRMNGSAVHCDAACSPENPIESRRPQWEPGPLADPLSKRLFRRL